MLPMSAMLSGLRKRQPGSSIDQLDGSTTFLLLVFQRPVIPIIVDVFHALELCEQFSIGEASNVVQGTTVLFKVRRKPS